MQKEVESSSILLLSLINKMNKILTMQVTVGEWWGDSDDGNDDQIVSDYDKSPLTTNQPLHSTLHWIVEL